MSSLKVSISEKGTDPPYNHLTLTGRTGAWVVVKIKPGDIKIYNLTWLLKMYLKLRINLARIGRKPQSK